MPWKDITIMDLRLEFVLLAEQESANIRELCRRYGITPRTGYKWIKRYKEKGKEGLVDQSRRPHHSPNRTNLLVEGKVLSIRGDHPVWGGRKIRAYLQNQGENALPSASTITTILRRNEQIDLEESSKHRPFQHFEMEVPNQLWQMDFKGYFELTQGGFCHPLTVLDDYSRYLVGLRACPDEKKRTVQAQLIDIFRYYGLPERLLMDNGPPWRNDQRTPYNAFSAWLMRLGIKVSHGRPYHPQTQGKDERLHRTLQDELLSRTVFSSLADCQKQFDSWRQSYNCARPHEALNFQPPISRYQPSLRLYPETLPPIVYEIDDIVRKVDQDGKVYFRNKVFRIGKAFSRYPVALRPSDIDGIYEVYFITQIVAQIDVRNGNIV